MAQLEKNGYRLAEVNAYVHPGNTDAFWNGIWVTGGGDRTAAWGWTREDFDARAIAA